MAKNTSSTTKIILIRSEDWEQWYEDLQANVSSEIWPYINPEGQQRALLQQPPRPEPTDFDNNAATYAQLSAAHQRAYENARRFYEQDKKDYARQQDQLDTARAYISASVSRSKRTSLKASQSVRQWLETLKKDTEPPKSYMIIQTINRYNETMRSFKPNRLSQWLDEWEAAMVEGIKYEIPEVQKGQWLRHLAQIFRSVSEVFSVRFIEDADDEEKSNPEEFRRVARKLREALGTQKGGRTVRGNAFHASFGEQPDEDSPAADDTQGTETAPPKGNRGRKRTGTQSIQTNPSKKEAPECPACGMSGHSLAKCWYVFEELMPKGMKLYDYRIQKTKKAVEDDEQLKEKIEEIREKMKKEAKPGKKKNVRFEDQE